MHTAIMLAGRDPDGVPVSDLDEPVETYSSGVRHVKVPDPDGNAIAFAELPDAASA